MPEKIEGGSKPSDSGQRDAAAAQQERKLLSNYARNKVYARQDDDYATRLNPKSEAQFRAWVAANKVPFDLKASINDYDMRGFWLALQSKDPAAVSAVNPYDKRIHYPDRWKTPYHETFSAESQWATPGAPSWNKEDQLVLPSGQMVFDSRKVAAPPAAQPVPAPPVVAPTAPQETHTNAPR